jgi:hypothetical protein
MALKEDEEEVRRDGFGGHESNLLDQVCLSQYDVVRQHGPSGTQT